MLIEKYDTMLINAKLNEKNRKFKTRIVIKEDLQMIDNAQNVYAAILASKIFRMLMIMMIAYRLKTRQLNALNAFLNAINDDVVYCYMSDDYKQSEKIFRMIRILYDQRKSSLLLLRTLITKCLKLELMLISDESCLFIDENDVFMFFYVNDVIFVYRMNRQQTTNDLIIRFNKMFEFRNLEEIKHFLEIRVIIHDQNDEDRAIYLVQDAYIDKLTKEYEISESKMQISLSSSSQLAKYDDEIDTQRMHEYRQKMKSICYFATMIRSNIVKIASKLIEFLINSESDHLIAANHCMRYLQNIKYLRIKYIAFDEDELTIAIERKHVFEIIVDVSFANENDRKSAEEYAFKLFEELID
jgi:hypothetical protein